MPAMAPPCRTTSSPLHRHPCPPSQTTPPHPTKHARASHGRGEARHWPERTRPARRRHAVDVARERATGTLWPPAASTPCAAPGPPCERLEHALDTATQLDTLSTTTRTRRRRRSQPWSAADATDMEETRHRQALPDRAVTTQRTVATPRTHLRPRLARPAARNAAPWSTTSLPRNPHSRL